MHMQAQPFILIFLAGHTVVLSTWQKQQEDKRFSFAENRLMEVVLGEATAARWLVFPRCRPILPKCVQHVPVGGTIQERHR